MRAALKVGLNPFNYTLCGGTNYFDFDSLIKGSSDGAQVFFASVIDPNAPPPGDPPADPLEDPPLTGPNGMCEVPEPGTLALIAGGLGLMVWVNRWLREPAAGMRQRSL